MVSHNSWEVMSSLIMKTVIIPRVAVVRHLGRGGRRGRNHAGVEAGTTHGGIVLHGRSVNHHLAPIVETVIVVDHIPLLLVESSVGSVVNVTCRIDIVEGEVKRVVLWLSWVSSRRRFAQMSKLLVIV